MPQRDAGVYPKGPEHYAAAAARFTPGLSLEQDRADQKTRAAVARVLEVCGEAMCSLYKLAPAVAEKIPSARDILAKKAHKRKVLQQHLADEARSEAKTAAKDPNFRGPIAVYQGTPAPPAGLDVAGHAAPACPEPDLARLPVSARRAVPLGTPGCRRSFGQRSPDRHSVKLLRSNPQILYIAPVTKVNRWLYDKKFLRNWPADCFPMAHLLRQTDWAQLGALLAD